MDPLGPLPFLSRATAKGFLFQFASHDQYVTGAQATEFFEASPVPHAMYVYDAHHDLNVPLARRDRLDWLQTRIF
jgi:hypothetical protein